MPSSTTSKYTIHVSNLSSATRSRDVRAECERAAGAVVEVLRDTRARAALVEFEQ